MLFILAPLALVVVFVLRSPSTGSREDHAVLAGYTITVSARDESGDARVLVAVEPAGRLQMLILREKPAPAGTPVAAAIYSTAGEGGPDMIYGLTPAPGDPDAIFETRVRGGGLGTVVVAEVSILGKTVSLTAPILKD